MTAESRPEAATGTLQFDTAELSDANGAPAGLTCAACQTPLRTYYFEANGAVICAGCKQTVESRSSDGDGSRGGRVARATLYGTCAALAGAALYYGVAALTGYVIGLIAIAVGYMVGLAVRTGSRGRGGWRYQTLAVALTHFAIGIAYFTQGMADMKKEKAHDRTPAASAAATPTAGAIGDSTANSSGTSRTSEPSPPAKRRPAEPMVERLGAGTVALGLVALVGFIAALPILAGLSEFPQHVIGLIIVGIALRQAWVMNRRVHVAISGPYRVGERGRADASATSQSAAPAEG